MTRRQLQALDFIRTFILGHGYSPSHDEIAGALSLKSKSGVNRILHGLRGRGYITFQDFRGRSISLVQPGQNNLYAAATAIFDSIHTVECPGRGKLLVIAPSAYELLAGALRESR